MNPIYLISFMNFSNNMMFLSEIVPNKHKMNFLPNFQRALMLLVVFIVPLVTISCKSDQSSSPPPLSVPVITAETSEVPVFRTFVGETFGMKDIDIRARVDGVLQGIHFKEGSKVQQDQLLYTIDPQPILEKEAASLSELAQAKTMLTKAESDLIRIRPLAESNAVSQRDLDAAIAQYDASKAVVEAAEARLRSVRLELQYTRISAPVTGIIGMSHAQAGDYVGREPNPVILNTISNTDSIKVRFFLTENEFLQFFQRGTDEKYSEKARQEGISLILSDNSVFPYKGRVDFADRSLDPELGSIMLQASFPNPDGMLRPGLFARVKILYDYKPETVLVPKRSVRELQTIYQVYVVGEGNKVQIRNINVEYSVGQFYTVNEGIKPGERIVYEGFEKLRPGMEVIPELTDTENLTLN